MLPWCLLGLTVLITALYLCINGHPRPRHPESDDLIAEADSAQNLRDSTQAPHQ